MYIIFYICQVQEDLHIYINLTLNLLLDPKPIFATNPNPGNWISPALRIGPMYRYTIIYIDAPVLGRFALTPRLDGESRSAFMLNLFLNSPYLRNNPWPTNNFLKGGQCNVWTENSHKFFAEPQQPPLSPSCRTLRLSQNRRSPGSRPIIASEPI